ncbi:MAG: hypothetical protein H0W72_02630, partial [Planctomycetes bacterium]|nr:hypothetical protein [Planctomycetota bacterium]
MHQPMSAEVFLRCVLIGTMFLSASTSAEPADAYGDGLAALQIGDLRRVEACCLDLAKDPATRFKGAMLRARVLESRGNVAAALAILESACKPGVLTDMPADLQLLVAHLLVLCQREVDALDICDRLGRAQTGAGCALAAEGAAEAYASLQRWDEADRWIAFAIAAAESVPADYRDASLVTRLHASKQVFADTREVLTHGIGYRLYRLANERRAAGDNREAVVLYDRLLAQHAHNRGRPIFSIASLADPRIEDLPIHDIYAAAASVYRGACLLEMGQYREAQSALTTAAQDRSSPYLAEALRLLGDTALEGSGDAILAARRYSEAIAWLDQAAARPPTDARLLVPDASRVVARPADRMRGYEGWGNLTWFHASPGQVYNADTCTWYGDYQRLLAQTRR